MSRLSIVIPSHNAEAYVGRCLSSILSQTLPDFEVVVVDDGSSDGTAQAVEAVAAKDKRVRLLRQEHCGVSAARNAGVASARGELIAFVDADDYLHPQYAELLVGALDAHPDADMSITPSVRTSETTDASLSVPILHVETSVGEGRELRKALFTGSGMLSHNQCHACHGKVFRRQLIEGLSFPENISVYEDAAWMHRVLQRVSRYVLVAHRLYFWYAHPHSTLAVSPRHQGLDVYRECLGSITPDEPDVRAACLSRLCLHALWLRHQGDSHSRLPLAVWREFFFSRHVRLKDKWWIARQIVSGRTRRKVMDNNVDTERRQRPAVGAPQEEQTGLVSVVVPVYNVAPWLPACLDSIVNQRYRLLDIILVDDGSTDGSGDICEQYARRDSRIRVVHQSNQGLSAARNTGLDLVRGEYVLMPDADDTLHPQLISLAHRALMQGDFPFAMVWASEVDKPVSYDSCVPVEGTSLRLLTQDELVGGLTNRTTMGINCHVVWNKLYRRCAICNLRFEETASQDTVFNTHLFLHVPYAIVVDASLYYWLQREGSLSRSPETPKAINRLLSSQRCINLCPAGSRYEAWFLSFLYNSIPRVRQTYALRSTEYNVLRSYARRVIRTVIYHTILRLFSNKHITWRMRWRLLTCSPEQSR